MGSLLNIVSKQVAVIDDQNKGFTLIELLVVIAIIALLLSILMPSLAKVKSVAKRLVCGTNIRQNGQAFFLYGTDNDGELYMAPTTGSFHNSFYSWGGVTMDWDYLYLGAPWNKDTHPYERVLNVYLPTETPVYICPSDPSGDTKLWAPFGVAGGINDNTQAYYSTTGTSYQYNAFLLTVCEYTKMTEITLTANTILINEWPAYDVLFNGSRPADWTDKPRWSFHDNSGRGREPFEDDENGNNTCFADGHVEYIDYMTNRAKASGYSWYDNMD